MATLTVQQATIAGVTPTFVAVAASDVFANNGKTYIEVKNGNAGADTVAIDSLVACNQGTDHDGGGSVPATTGDKIFGPFDPTRFNNANGQVTITHSVTATVTCTVFTL